VTCVELEIDAYTVVAEVLPLLGTIITLVVVEGEASVVALTLDRNSRSSYCKRAWEVVGRVL